MSGSAEISPVVSELQSKHTSSLIHPFSASVFALSVEVPTFDMERSVCESGRRLVRSRQNPGRGGKLPGVSASNFSFLQAVSIRQTMIRSLGDFALLFYTVMCTLFAPIPFARYSFNHSFTISSFVTINSNLSNSD